MEFPMLLNVGGLEILIPVNDTPMAMNDWITWHINVAMGNPDWDNSYPM